MFTLAVIVLVLGYAAANTDDFENSISPEDLDYFAEAMKEGVFNNSAMNNPTRIGNRFWPEEDEIKATFATPIDEVDCFGVGDFMAKIRWLFNLKPMPSNAIQTKFFLSTRMDRSRTEIPSRENFSVEGLDFNAFRPTVFIVHGFMSHSNASWVLELTSAFLNWKDCNVISVDWSKGGNTWKYWRAVANARTVGTDLTNFLIRLKSATGCLTKDFHFVGHSLGAHICAFAANKLGGVKRITGLDPAQPCFRTNNKAMKLDSTDAEFVDIIHTNGRLLAKIGFGLPDPIGHADFYPNGGLKQPGCYTEDAKKSFFQKLLPVSIETLNQAICSHGRSYLLFTESLISNNCTFMGHKWRMSDKGLNSSSITQCSRQHRNNCGQMGINAYGGRGEPRSLGQFYVETKDTEPFCTIEPVKQEKLSVVLADLIRGFTIEYFTNATYTRK